MIVLPQRGCTVCPLAGPFRDKHGVKRIETIAFPAFAASPPPPHPQHRCRLSGTGSRRSRGPSVRMLHNRVPCFPTDTPSAPQLMATWWCQGEKWEEGEEGTEGRELALCSQQSPTHPCSPPNKHPAIWTCVITEGWRSTPSHPHLLWG